jgi:hypothetical protein
MLALVVKVGKVCRPKVLPLGILDVPLLSVFAHLLNVFGSILLHSRVVTVWANHDMAVVGVIFRLWVGAASTKACPRTLSAAVAACARGTGSQQALVR